MKIVQFNLKKYMKNVQKLLNQCFSVNHTHNNERFSLQFKKNLFNIRKNTIFQKILKPDFILLNNFILCKQDMIKNNLSIQIK